MNVHRIFDSVNFVGDVTLYHNGKRHRRCVDL